MDIIDFLNLFQTNFENESLAIAVGDKTIFKNYTFDDLPVDVLENNGDKNVFFSPAVRDKKSDNGKLGSVLGSACLWFEVDKPEFEWPILPPTLVVRSGKGHHGYYFLKEPTPFSKSNQSLQVYNKIVARNISNSDGSVFNANRLLRIPNTTNIKPDREPLDVFVVYYNSEYIYDLKDFNYFDKLTEDHSLKKVILTGDSSLQKDDKSARDFVVMIKLLSKNIPEHIIKYIFTCEHFGISNKEHGDYDHYFDQSIEKAKQVVLAGPENVKFKLSGDDQVITGDGIFQLGTAYFKHSAKSARVRISNFIIEPKAILTDLYNEIDEQFLLSDIVSQDHKITNVVFSSDDFMSASNLLRRLKSIVFSFTGNDADVKILKEFLFSQVVKNQKDKHYFTNKTGLHRIDGRYVYLLADSIVITNDGIKEDNDELILKMKHDPIGKIYVNGSSFDSEEEKKDFVSNLLNINEEHNTWSIIGWAFAVPLKSWLFNNGIKFPILNLTGSRGSGKSTIIQSILLPMLGYPKESGAVNAETTKFSVLTFGSQSNAFPVSITELRSPITIRNFTRTILLSYDNSTDTRGNADRSLDVYRYTTPLIFDGEDFSRDPACQERLVLLKFNQNYIRHGTDAELAHQKLQTLDLSKNASGYYKWLLSILNSDDKYLLNKYFESANIVSEQFSGTLSSRVLNNFSCVYFGMSLFCDYYNVKLPSSEVLTNTIANIYNFGLGRVRLLFDDFATDVVNYVDQAAVPEHGGFYFAYNKSSFVFSITSAYYWWKRIQRSFGREVFDVEALMGQINDVEYAKLTRGKRGSILVELDLLEMNSKGLDVPFEMQSGMILDKR